MTDRDEAFRDMRQRQSIVELSRKAKKAVRRQNIWTVEELDYIKVKARLLSKALNKLMK